MNTEKTDQEKKSGETGFSFPFGDPKEMMEMMKQCCSGGAGMSACCSKMKEMMGMMKMTGQEENKEEAKKSGEQA